MYISIEGRINKKDYQALILDISIHVRFYNFHNLNSLVSLFHSIDLHHCNLFIEDLHKSDTLSNPSHI